MHSSLKGFVFHLARKHLDILLDCSLWIGGDVISVSDSLSSCWEANKNRDRQQDRIGGFVLNLPTTR